MSDGEKSNLAAILGGVAAVIMAISGLVAALKQSPDPQKPVVSGTPEAVDPTPSVSQSTTPKTEQTLTGDANIQISGSNNIVNPLPPPKPCRDKSHGIERFSRTFNADKTSPWMGGGYSQDSWCDNFIAELRGQNPEATFKVLDQSERNQDTCPPFNCAQYQYYCKVRINTDPIYIEKLTSACR